jgi:hypothetical protein
MRPKPGFQLALLVLLATLASAEADRHATLKFQVLKHHNGKPVRNASVIMHSVRKSGKQAKGGLQLKTNSEGKTYYDGIPYGKLRVQVLAEGFQTYGEDYEIDQPEMEIVVKLKRPQDQYTIYGEKPAAKPEDKPAPPEDKPEKKDPQ